MQHIPLPPLPLLQCWQLLKHHSMPATHRTNHIYLSPSISWPLVNLNPHPFLTLLLPVIPALPTCTTPCPADPAFLPLDWILADLFYCQPCCCTLVQKQLQCTVLPLCSRYVCHGATCATTRTTHSWSHPLTTDFVGSCWGFPGCCWLLLPLHVR